MNAVEELAAVAEISAVKARYFRAVDASDWGGLRELFADDATVWMSFDWPEPKPVDIAIASYARVLSRRASVHTGTLLEAVVVSECEATAVWTMDDRLFVRGPHTGDPRLIAGTGWYHERYRRESGEWRIADLVLTRSRVDTYGSIGGPADT